MSHIGNAIQSRFEPCRCDACKYGKNPGTGVSLDVRPGVARRLELAAIRDGRYADIDAEFDQVQARYMTGFAAAARHVIRTLEPVWRAEEARLARIAQQPTQQMGAVA